MVLPVNTTEIVASFLIDPHEEEVMLVTDAGQIIRMPVSGVRNVSRNSKGVRLFNIDDANKVVSVAKINDVSDDEEGDNDLEEGDEGYEPPNDSDAPDAPDATTPVVDNAGDANEASDDVD